MTSEDFGPETYLQLLAVLMHVSPRWVSADFRGLVQSCVRALDAVTEKLPQLEALTIDFDDSVQVEEVHAFSDAPRLRAVYIDYAPQRMMDTRSLVSLVSPSGYFTTEMLSECPKLESLTVYGITSYDDEGRRRTLKSITHISLGHDDQLVFLDLPNLVELEIATSVCPELTVTNFLEHSRCPLRKLSLLRCQRNCLQFVEVPRLTPTIEQIIIEFDDFFWPFKFTEMILFLENGGGGDEDEAERRRERGLRAGLESLMDFVGIVKSSKLLPDPPLSLPCLDQFCLSFEFLQSDEVQLLHDTFSNQSIVQAFLLEGIAFSLRPFDVGIM